jgi:DNA-binding MarR family transcriptional regulator
MAQAPEQDHIDRFLEELKEKQIVDLDFEVEAIVDRIMGLERRIKRSLEETLAEFELNHGEWKVLGSLVHSDPPHRRSPGWLADQCGLSSGAMTNRLDRLEEAGLVRRLPDPSDRRALHVELTEEGMRLWRETVGAQGVKEQLVTSALNEREKQQLNGLLRKLMVAFERLEGPDASYKKATKGETS